MDFWRVRSMNGSDVSAWSTVGNFKTNIGPAGLLYPTVSVLTTSPTFVWSPVTNAASYQVQTSIDGGKTYVNLTGGTATAPAVSVTASVAALKLATGQSQIYWRVVTTGVTGYGTSISSPLLFVPVSAPSIPVLNLPATGSQQTTTSPKLKWTTSVPANSSVPTAWDVQIATDTNFTNIAASASGTGTVETSTATSFVRSWVVSPALNGGTTYYWHVRSKNSQNLVSGWSTTFSFKTPLSGATSSIFTVTATVTTASPVIGQLVSVNTSINGTVSGPVDYLFKCESTNVSFINNGGNPNFSCSYGTTGLHKVIARVVTNGLTIDSQPASINLGNTSLQTCQTKSLPKLAGHCGGATAQCVQNANGDYVPACPPACGASDNLVGSYTATVTSGSTTTNI